MGHSKGNRMKTKEMERILTESFGATIDISEISSVNGNIGFIAIFISETHDLINNKSMFKGFWTGNGVTKTKAIRDLYVTLRDVTWKIIRLMDDKK